MNTRSLVSAAAAGLLTTLWVTTPVSAQDMPQGKGKEKCYGVAKAGQNDCANLSGSHSCAGQSKVANSMDEWKYVAKGTCAAMNGKTGEQLKAPKKG